VEEFRQLGVHAFALGTGIPTSSIMDLAAGRDVKVLDLSSIYEDMKKINPAYKLVTIPKGTYPKQDKDIQTIGYYTHVVVSCSLPEGQQCCGAPWLHSGEVDRFVEQGRKSNALFILLNGRARVLTSDSRGREVILAVLEAGDYVGEMSLIDNEAHSATVRCEIQTDMLILGRSDFARCLPENSTLAYAVLRGLVRRLRHADRQIESLALLDVYGRVARTLLEMAEDVNGVKLIRNKVSRQDMAKVVGASREMVSRVMKDLEERGVIETQENGSVIIKERSTQPE